MKLSISDIIAKKKHMHEMWGLSYKTPKLDF